MVIAYTRVFSIGAHSHRVELFESYSAEKGCTNLISTHQNTRANLVLNDIKAKISLDQYQKIKASMSYKSDIIIDEFGNYHNN